MNKETPTTPPENYNPAPAYRHYWGCPHLYRVNALCADGKVRRATITGEPQTWFSVPARVQANGKTVSGWLTTSDVMPGTVYTFHTYKPGKNAGEIEDRMFYY